MTATDHEAAAREALDALCRDSLESSLDDVRAIPPKFVGHVDALFQNLAAALDALVGLLQQARLENERLRREASAVADTRSGGDS